MVVKLGLLLLHIPVAARRLVAVVAIQPQTTAQLGVLRLELRIFL